MSNLLNDYVDTVVAAQLQEHRVAGLTLAVIDSGKIVRAQGYGFTDRNRKTPVTPDTLFQAASISKPIAAFGALQLVEQGRLALDQDVNIKLRSWKIPENEFTAREKVTLRRLLSHTAGMTVHGFSGYPTDQPLPALLQVLNGEPPARNSPIRVDAIPGTAYRYSGGGYTVLQQLMIDVTGQPFAEWMEASVLRPLGMTSSTFGPLPETFVSRAARGVLPDGNEIPGGWHRYPEMAAAALWATASDLTRFIMGVQQSLAGKPGSLLSPAMTREMLTPQVGSKGLGLMLEGAGKTQRFMHAGSNRGYDAFMMGLSEFGRGVVVMHQTGADKKIAITVTQAVIKEHWARRARK